MASVSSAALRQLLLVLLVARQQPAEIGGGAEIPALGDAREIDAAPGVMVAQFLEHGAHVRARGHVLADLGLVERFGRGEQQRLGDAHGLARAALRPGP